MDVSRGALRGPYRVGSEGLGGGHRETVVSNGEIELTPYRSKRNTKRFIIIVIFGCECDQKPQYQGEIPLYIDY